MSKSKRQQLIEKSIEARRQKNQPTEEKPKGKGIDRGQKAVALKYNADKDAAPVVIASGYGPIAERIIDIAEQRGIPVYRDDSAASMLCMLGVGANIPEELYQVVAKIYSQILTVAAKLQSGENGLHSAVGRNDAADPIQKLRQVTAELVDSDGIVQTGVGEEDDIE